MTVGGRGAGGGGGLDCALADVTAPAIRRASKVVRMGAMARSLRCCNMHNIWGRAPTAERVCHARLMGALAVILRANPGCN
jgi:hypothetical protein